VRKVPADPKQLWERYVLTRNRVAVYFAKELVPVLAVWDDHDFGTDNGDQTYAYKNESAEIFATFFAQEARPALVAGPGIARRFSAFGADFHLLDGRTFRDPVGTADGRIFGVEQEAWFYGGLADKPMLLMSGSLFFGAYQKGESFEGDFAANFTEFLARLKAAGGLCAFVSGDVHYSELMDIEATQLGYSTFEIVSSGMHSYTFPGHERRFNNPRRRDGCAMGGHNFVVFEAEFSSGQIRGEVTSYSASKVEFTTAVLAQR
jgi:alkaline phosphatase D